MKKSLIAAAIMFTVSTPALAVTEAEKQYQEHLLLTTIITSGTLSAAQLISQQELGIKTQDVQNKEINAKLQNKALPKAIQELQRSATKCYTQFSFDDCARRDNIWAIQMAEFKKNFEKNLNTRINAPAYVLNSQTQKWNKDNKTLLIKLTQDAKDAQAMLPYYKENNVEVKKAVNGMINIAYKNMTGHTLIISEQEPEWSKYFQNRK